MAPSLLCIIYKSVSWHKDQSQKKGQPEYQIKQINKTWLVDWKDAYMIDALRVLGTQCKTLT